MSRTLENFCPLDSKNKGAKIKKKVSLKENHMSSGIYKITNTLNGSCYVGSAVNLGNRKSNHFSALSRRSHYNYHLQNSYNKYGKDSFCFSVLEYCSKESLIEREQHFIDILQPEYNISRVAGSSFGTRRTIDVREKMSIALKGRAISPETRTKMSVSQKGRIITPETRLKISLKMTGRVATKETREKMSRSRKIKESEMSKVSEVYSYVHKYLVSNSGRSPSYGEIMSACGITSKSNVRPILEKLAELGMLELEEGARGIRIPNSRLIVE